MLRISALATRSSLKRAIPQLARQHTAARTNSFASLPAHAKPSTSATSSRAVVPRVGAFGTAGSSLSMSTEAAAADAPEIYSFGTRLLHWVAAGGMIGCVGLVLNAQSLPAFKDCTPEQKKKKTDLMYYHKSIGLLMLGVMIPRVGLRLIQKAPPAPAGHMIEKLAGHASHLGLYGLGLFLPASGFVMGYMGGAGLPFFFTKFKPASGEFGKAKNGKMAGNAFKLHKQAGVILEYFIPVHVGAAAFHYVVKGQNLLKRISLFASAAK